MVITSCCQLYRVQPFLARTCFAIRWSMRIAANETTPVEAGVAKEVQE